MKILVVDDAATVRWILRQMLEAKGHSVIEAADGEQALTILDGEEVEGVVSDILMPNMDGFRLCLEIRKRVKLRRLPFVFFTETYTSTQDREAAKMVGAHGLLLKSASAEAIVEALQHAREIRHDSPVPEENEIKESAVLKQYNVALIKKLEKRNVELNQALLRIIELNATLERRVAERTAELTQALSEVKEMSGLLPICSYCKRIRDDKDYWDTVENYVSLHTRARFNHRVCPDCVEKHIAPMLGTLGADLCSSTPAGGKPLN